MRLTEDGAARASEVRVKMRVVVRVVVSFMFGSREMLDKRLLNLGV
jgi:hypothetical protein